MAERTSDGFDKRSRKKEKNVKLIVIKNCYNKFVNK